MAARKRRRELEGPPVYAHREGQLEGESPMEQGLREEVEGAQARLKDSYFRKMAATKLDLPAGNASSPGSRVAGRELDYPLSGGGEALINISTTFLEGMTEWAMNKLGGGSSLPLTNSDIVRSRWGDEFFSRTRVGGWFDNAMASQIFHGGADYRQYSKDFDVLPSALLKKKASQWLSYLSSTKWSAGPEGAKTSIRADGAAWQKGRSDDGVPHSVESNLSTAGLIALNEMLEAVQFLPLSKQMSFYGKEGKARASSQVQEFNKGGQVRGYNMGGSVDTVPAMLTPGEFVMNARSVNKYGSGFMNQLNQGNYLARGGYPYAGDSTKKSRFLGGARPGGVGHVPISYNDPRAGLPPGYWVDPSTPSPLAKRPMEGMRKAAIANLMGPDPLSINSTWEMVPNAGDKGQLVTYRQLAISQFKHHWENTPFIPGTSTKADWAAYDSKYKWLRLTKFGEPDPIASPSDRPADPRFPSRDPRVTSRRNDPGFHPRTSGDVWNSRAGSTTTDIKKPPLPFGDLSADKIAGANLPEGTPGWVRFHANMGNWQMEDAALYQRIAQAWFPEEHARQKDFTEALGWQWDAFMQGSTPGISDLQHFLGISGFNDKPTGAAVRLHSDWFGKYASGPAKALMGSGFGSDIDQFGFGHFTGKGATKYNVDELWAKKDSGDIDKLTSLYLDEKGRWGGSQHKLARFGWWKKEWQKALSSWGTMEGVDIRNPDQVERDFGADMRHQQGRFAEGKDAQDFFGTLANHGTPWASGNLLYNFDVGQELMTKLLGTSDNAGYSGDREATLERYVGFIQQMLDMQSGDTSMYGDLFKPQGRETGKAEMRLSQQKFAKGSGPLHKKMMETVLQLERDKQALYTSKYQDTINSQMANLHKKQFAEFNLPYIQIPTPLPTAQDPSSSIAGGEWLPGETMPDGSGFGGYGGRGAIDRRDRKRWSAKMGDTDSLHTTFGRLSPKEKAAARKKSREDAHRRASGGISRASAGVKLVGGQLWYQDAAAVENFLKGIRYGVARLSDDSYLGKKGEMAQLLVDGRSLPDRPWGEMSTLNDEWIKKTDNMKAGRVAWPGGLAAVEGEENWQHAHHIISKLGMDRAGEEGLRGFAPAALAGKHKKYLEKRLETATLWDSSDWRAPRGQRVPKGGVVAKPLGWGYEDPALRQAGGVGSGPGYRDSGGVRQGDYVGSNITLFRFESEKGKTWTSAGMDLSTPDALILKEMMDKSMIVQKFAAGGQVDSVPAMLTPGEFVMKPSAVNKYGAGFMHKLNQGKVSGFNQGGVVYLAGGGFGNIGGAAAAGAANFPLGGKLDLLTTEQAEELIIKRINGMVSMGADGKLANSKATRTLTNLMISAGYDRKNVRDFIKAKISKDPTDDPVMENVKVVEFVRGLSDIINKWAPRTLHSASGAGVQVSDDPSIRPGGGGGAGVLAPGALVAGALGGGGGGGVMMASISPIATFLNELQAKIAGGDKDLKLLSKLAPGWTGMVMGLSGALQGALGDKFGAVGFAGGGRGAFNKQQKAMEAAGHGLPPWFAQMFPQGFAAGGSVDSVPAMLTPGEFVMNKQAVKQHGTSFMSALNKGQVAGFAQGGPVSYLANGGSAGATSFLDDLSQIITSLSGIAGVFAGVFGGTMHHTISFDGSLKVKGMNFEFIAEGIKAELGNYIITEVATHFAAQKNNFNAT